MQRVSEYIALRSTILILRKLEASIILQIWRNSFSPRLCRFAIPIRVIAESGLLYTLTSIATFCAVLLSPHEWFMVVTAIVCHEFRQELYLTHAPRTFPLR